MMFAVTWIYTFSALLAALHPEVLAIHTLRQRTEQRYTENRMSFRIPIKPKCTKFDEDFCQEVENYPVKLLETVLPAEKEYQALFGDDGLQYENFTRRMDDDDAKETLCECRERIIFPQAGVTKENDWSIIINHSDYKQGILIEECVNPNGPCSGDPSFPLGLQHECEQKYIYRQLVSVDSKGDVMKEFFRLPACCMCSLFHKDY
ncbi:unnamed protein product [Hermetia illucens]|uniref:Spaetzle domain-containing protein n=1 Tax=Hermetia illucens TaxID=343691 RepID=A0A7R8ULW7_HERIL|nr:protein spaetzle-like [Hermetia illucens]XP_037907198.1 protein spaetzle-like [Hermetia illucens]XP_037907199.1 protein spaetzle-like [Hermetia illucens]CAD7082899.1 unnamed protein product [Hermetia illucens]